MNEVRDPKVGDPILLLGLVVNNEKEHAGIVTKFYIRNKDSFAVIDATVFINTVRLPECYGSIPYADTREEAEKYLMGMPDRLICVPR